MSQNGRQHATQVAPTALPPEARGGVLLNAPGDDLKVLNQVLQAGQAMAMWPSVAGMLPLAVTSTEAQPAWQRAAILSTLLALAECQGKVQQALIAAESGRRGAPTGAQPAPETESQQSAAEPVPASQPEEPHVS